MNKEKNKVKYSVWNLNPGYDQWHIIKKEQTFTNHFRADQVLKIISGKGLNVCRLLHNLGFEEYECINIVGGMTGRVISHLCKEEMLNCLDYHISEESRINFCIIDEYKGSTVSYNDPGPKLMGRELDGFVFYLKEYIKTREDTDIVISGAPCRGFDMERFQELLSYIEVCGNKVIIDIAGQWLKEAAGHPVFILKVNREEFLEAFHLDAFLFNENLKRFKEDNRISNLIVTDGANGCVVYDAYGKGYAGKVEGIKGGICAVGSGDSFLGGYLQKLAYGYGTEECITFANACGIANTFEYGPAMIDLPKIMNYVKYSKVYEMKEG